MQKIAGQHINDLMLEIGAKLNESIFYVIKHSSKEEGDYYRRAISNIMGIMLIDIMNPIYRQYPELKPEDLE